MIDQSSVALIEKAIDDKIRRASSKDGMQLAKVTRVSNDGTTWVQVFGGADETPVGRMYASASVGDIISVAFSGLSCTGIGNYTAPSASQKQVDKVSTESAQAIRGVMDGLLQVRRVVADKVTAKELEAEVATINEALINKASVNELAAATGRIGAIEADTADIGEIRANAAKVADLDVEQLEADHAAIASLDANYAHADLANVNNAWIENGVIKDAAITNEMVGSLSANKLTAGTINGANINVTNLKADNITTGTLNGERIGQGSLSLDKLSEDVYTETEVDAIVEGLNDRIDGAIETHTGTVVPTLNNSPASAWNTADLKDEHVGDVYYVVNSQSQQNGYCYRFTKSGNSYSWQLIKDSDVTAALSRISTAEGKITTFDSDISTLKTDTGELKTKTQTLETSLGDKVDTSTFNELSSTVDENSATITSMNTVLTNNGLTSSTNITQTVNSVSQTATSNSSTISQLVTTLGTNADGTTKAGDIVHRTSAVEQDLSGFKTTVSQNYASKTSVEDAQADATKALNRQVAYSATCSTAAGTAAKVATCTNFPTLAAGVTVTVRFSAANTSAGAITLNVNSTGAKTIYVNGAATAAGNQMLWASNANVTFTYDGTYWRVVSEPRTWYGTCATAAGTAAKAATINEVVVCKGTVVKLNMTYENTSTSATLNLTSTGAKNLYYGTTATRPTTANGYGWGAASTATFVFDGQYWRVGDTSVLSRLIQAETTISSHTTSINQNAESIALKADATDVYTKTQTDGLISTEVTNRNAAIEASADAIELSVSETYSTKQELSSAKADIKATTDGISTEVSKKVGNSEIISKINQSAETVKIQASKVEIDGTAIFTALGSANKVVTATQTQWYSSTSPTTKSGGSWGTSQPSVAAGRYIWQREYLTYSDGSHEYKPSEAGVCVQGQTNLSGYATESFVTGKGYQTASQVSEAVGAANAEEQTIYIQAAQNAVSTEPPSEWVEYSSECTTATEADGTTTWSTPVWSTKRPTFCPAYPTVLVAKQRKSMDGTVTCTTPLIDDTTTVIDGGRIITGSVTANAIDATDLHVKAANIDGTLTASQIDTEGLELSISAVTGLGDELEDISGRVDSKASSDSVAQLSDSVSSMSGTVDAALGEGGTLDKLRGDVDTIQAHISLGTVGEGSSLQPAITLDAQGGSSDGFRNVITNTAMSFMYGNETVAEVNKDELDITRTKVTESMQLGNFMWIPLSDGSLAFKWVEEDE